MTEDQQRALFAGDTAAEFADKLEHAARETWNLAKTEPERQMQLVEWSRNIGRMAKQVRALVPDTKEAGETSAV